MSTDLLTREEVREELAGNSDDDCLVCRCRPKVTLCGGYTEKPTRDVDWSDDDTCAECVRVAASGCPGCGCRGHDTCRLCDPSRVGEPRARWRRWFS